MLLFLVRTQVLVIIFTSLYILLFLIADVQRIITKIGPISIIIMEYSVPKRTYQGTKYVRTGTYMVTLRVRLYIR